MRKITVLMLALAATGCASTKQKWYYNNHVPRDQQQVFYNQDATYCKAVANGSVAIPPPITPSSGYRTLGTLTLNNLSTGQTYVGNYNSTTSPTNSMAKGFAAGWALSDALVRRNNLFNACMARVGWFEIPCQDCIPSS